MLARYYFPHRVVITFAAVLIGTMFVRADDLNVTGNATISGDTDLRGPVSFGRLTEDTNAKGFYVDVSQEGHLTYNEVFTEGSWSPQQTWVEEGYYMQVSTWVNIYDWVNHPYWVPDTVDIDGIIITPGYYADNFLWEYVRMEEQWTPQWTSSGGHYDYSQIWVEGYYTSVPVQTYDAPQVHYSGTRSNTAWIWRNPGTTNSGGMRDLMVLSQGGLSFPAPDDATGTSRALVTHTNFEQSYTSPQVANSSYQSFGSKVGKNKIEVWDHLGHSSADPNNAGSAYTVLENKSESTLAPLGLTLSYSESSDGGNTMNTTTTTITASSASFGGSMGVKGVLRAEPSGDLSMGVYTNGTRP